jgi:hypothetical protein
MDKRVVLWVLAILCLIVLCYLVFFFLGVSQEREQDVVGKIYRAKSDIIGINNALLSYKKAKGSYPFDLVELTQKSTEMKSDEPLLREIPVSPWGPYNYQLNRESNIEKYKLWVVPDHRTKEIANVTELSNETNWQIIMKRVRE